MKSNLRNESALFETQEWRRMYLHACRLLQWCAERLAVDRRSCAMRGMDQADWCRACTMLIHAGLMDSRLSLLVGPDNALHQLRAHFDGGQEPKSMPCDSHTDASLWLNTPDHFPTSLPHVREQLTGEFVAKVNAI